MSVLVEPVAAVTSAHTLISDRRMIIGGFSSERTSSFRTRELTPQSQSARVLGTSVCAVQVRAGHEAAAARRIMRAAQGAAIDVFCPQCELARREAGEWKVESRLLLPGYVLVRTSDAEALERALATVGSVRLVGEGGAPGALSAEEARAFAELGGEKHVLRMSLGTITDGVLHVSQGALVGREHLVRKIDRHRRMAWAELVPGRRLRVGLEVVSKS